MAATQLTPNGWSGASSGVWSRQANVVIDLERGIEVVGSKLINAIGGNDVITGEQVDGPGLFVPNDPKRGNLQLGKGDDSVTGTSRSGDGIQNLGFIFMGPGNDQITGSGATAIRNRGFVFTQGGDDAVDARDGRIFGRGFVDLGSGNNTFIGFGNHTLYGGGGLDTLLLPRGTYDLSRQSKTRYRLEKGNNELDLFDFDVIGAVNSRQNQRLELDQGGTLVVRNNGNISIS